MKTRMKIQKFKETYNFKKSFSFSKIFFKTDILRVDLASSALVGGLQSGVDS